MQAGMEVLANYNMKESKKRGIWLKVAVDQVNRKEMICILYIGMKSYSLTRP